MWTSEEKVASFGVPHLFSLHRLARCVRDVASVCEWGTHGGLTVLRRKVQDKLGGWGWKATERKQWEGVVTSGNL